ncbi:MAG: hypothetical protein RMJ51_06550 [Candidatus Calescibacterium sp.]|nr:hypothetical protein [Candidatus Calescibacterium sp.]MCX7972803.1 hypothetical protein [bacterium]MDW8195877.1 hypothetical protein [Candidatus Calescibacterium sp.]
MMNKLTLSIGKVASFYGGYIYLRYRYNDFIKNSLYLNVGNFLVVSSINENNYILAQIVDIYDAVIEKEENLRISIANDGSITSTEIDIYLFIELKLKPLFEFNAKELVTKKSMFTTRLKDVFLFDGDLKKDFYKVFFSINPKAQVVNLKFAEDVLVYGVVFLLGIDDFLGIPEDSYVTIFDYQKFSKRIPKKRKAFFISPSVFLNNYYDLKNLDGVVFVKISNRMELIKLANRYLIPHFIVGRNLLRSDYDIICRLVGIRNDYLSCFSWCNYYLIHKGVIFCY